MPASFGCWLRAAWRRADWRQGRPGGTPAHARATVRRGGRFSRVRSGQPDGIRSTHSADATERSLTDLSVAPGGLLRYGTSAGRWVLAATVLGSGLAVLDSTVVGIALPAISRDLGADLAGLQWVITAYMLTLAGLLLFGGALGDRFGRRRIFVLGTVWFAAASVMCGLA